MSDLVKTLKTDLNPQDRSSKGECSGSVVEHRTSEGEVGGSKPTSAVLCP